MQQTEGLALTVGEDGGADAGVLVARLAHARAVVRAGTRRARVCE